LFNYTNNDAAAKKTYPVIVKPFTYGLQRLKVLLVILGSVVL